MKELPVLQPSYAPIRNLMLYLTEDCNLRCTYCFVKKSPRTMSVETAHKTIDYLFHRNITGNRRDVWITFFGGEPFLAMDLMEEVIDYARCVAHQKRKTVRFCATTNATVANDRVRRIVSTNSMPLLVSVDGAEDAMEQRPYLGGGSPYEAVKRNLKKLSAWSPGTIGRVTYHPESLDLAGNVRHVLGMGVSAVSLCPVVESDWRGREEKLEQAYQELAEWFITEALEGRFLPLEVTWHQLLYLHAAQSGGSRPARPCGVATSLVAVDPDGHVMPCHRYLYRKEDWFGTVETTEFPPERERYVRISSRDLLGCDTCLAEPVCGGGCRYLVVTAGQNMSSGTHPGHCLNTRAQARAAYHIYQTLMEQIPEKFSSALRRYPSAAGMFGELAHQ
jgi:uncharacterized protein